MREFRTISDYYMEIGSGFPGLDPFSIGLTSGIACGLDWCLTIWTGSYDPPV